MAKFKVIGSVNASVIAEVEAESEKEALERAEELSLNDWEFVHQSPEEAVVVDGVVN